MFWKQASTQIDGILRSRGGDKEEELLARIDELSEMR